MPFSSEAPLVPTPIDLPRPRRTTVLRRGAATSVGGARRLGPLLITKARGKPVAPADIGRRLRLLFEDLGGTFTKLGQLIACAESIVGPELADAFRGTLDRGPAVPFDQVRATVESELGGPLQQRFRSFEERPMAAASIAVVHRAVLPDGQPVAVKILRPGIEALVATDLAVMEPVLHQAARQLGLELARLLHGVVVGLREQLSEELNLANEARALDHFRRLLAHYEVDRITAPAPIHSHTGRRVLTMELLDGVPIDDVTAVGKMGIDPRSLVEQLVKSWFITALRHGVFHGDVHAGNLLWLRDGRIGVIDWGIVGRLDPENLHFFRQAVRASLGEESAWADVAAHVLKVYGPGIGDLLGLADEEMITRYVRYSIEPLLTRPFGEVSIAMMVNGPPPELFGAPPPPKSFRERRRFEAQIMDAPGMGGSFDRAQFLLGKQLVYFERYGRMYLPDVSLLEDRAFFESVLADLP
jgi:predicted unusual protein kinase regulating ubiquinone biosynthesis (AarF/ABC1/UbiB family)